MDDVPSPPIKRKRPVVGITILLLVVVIPTLLFFVIPLGIKAYDDAHHLVISCDVRSASRESESSGSFKGGGGSGPQVVVVSEECGKILLQDGVNSFNADRVASEISSTKRVRFTVGAGSYDLREVLATFGVSPAAYTYEVDSDQA
ncbi:hypothetical protein OVA26_17235 [Microbacterium sp. SL62]|uniref:hypothetical protein n=1 Tax=Microbacterium sp. SL62 TaxID=2995139 RepID=UPI002274E37D|nr:hypothetical protein [Microbacterium sp. SL62]MCY1718683.1 hypothetical protein [Microbacterium sp. SL62]